MRWRGLRLKVAALIGLGMMLTLGPGRVFHRSTQGRWLWTLRL